MAEAAFFFLIAVVAIASAIGMLVARNPVSSALWLVLNLFCIAAAYILLNAEFIGIIQILVYAGAIMVLFLFVIMLLNLDAVPRVSKVEPKKAIAFVLGIVVLSQLVYVVALTSGVLPDGTPQGQTTDVGSALNLGLELFSRYAFHLEIIAVLLLAATIGAVLLAKKRFV
jgi:NADH-quinone oxidoreductase subunit J